IIKDNIGTADKMKTSAGSIALRNHVPKEDAFLIKKLRKAGALILGKANLSEWANFRSSRSTSGWSSRGGQTLNPYVLNRSPCGSSSGSAVAVAANLCSASIGTETDGSIICPAHVNSVVGIKPSVGLISRTGIIPISHNQDTAGPIARTVKDAAILLGALVGSDKDDPLTLRNIDLPNDYQSSFDENGLKEARIGVARNFFGKNDLVDSKLNKGIQKMNEAGTEIIDPVNLEVNNELAQSENEVLLYDFKHDIAKYFDDFGNNLPFKTLRDLIEYNKKHEAEIMPYFGQEIFLAAEEKGPLTDENYLKALKKCHKFSRDEEIDKILDDHDLDAIVAPSGGPAWPIDFINGDHFTFGSSRPAAVAGYPSITVPAGYVFGLPVGLTFIGGLFQEPILIRLCYAFERIMNIRHQPKYKNDLKLY
ncbi:MAG: amidase, partial [Asgard group archaeon]|nr:amidase [Asgard group archaeon]